MKKSHFMKVINVILALTLVSAMLISSVGCGHGSYPLFYSKSGGTENAAVDTSGGIVEDARQNARLAVPAGAVTEDENFSVSPTKSPTLSGGMSILGDAFEFGPAEKTFDQPITVTLNYEESKLPEGITPDDLLLCVVDNEGNFIPLENITVDTEAGTISGETKHFSVIAITYIKKKAELKVYPEGVNFGDVLVLTTATKTVTIANDTQNDMVINRLQIAPFADEAINPFAVFSPAFGVADQNKLPMTIPAGSNQEISLTFAPVVPGPYRADLLVSSEDATARIPVDGQGVLSVGLFEVVPNFYDFGAVILKPTAQTKTAGFTIMNNTLSSVKINAVQVGTFPFSTGTFALAGPSPAGTTLKSAGGTAALQASYTPATENMEFGYILVQGTDSAGKPVGAVSLLQGKGVSGVEVKIDPLDFGKVLVGTTKTMNTTIYNTGTLDFNQCQYKTNHRAFNPAFVWNPVAPLAAGQSAPAAINFTPERRGPYLGVTVTASARIDKGWIHSSAPVTGTGVDSYISVNPYPADFFLVCVGNTEKIPVTITNVGDFDLKFVNVGNVAAPFGIENPPNGNMAIGQSLTFTVVFSPTQEGVFTSSFTFSVEFDHDGMIYTDTYTLPIYGLALDCGEEGEKKIGITVQPDIDFGDVLVGTTEEKTTTVTNISEEIYALFVGKHKPIVFDATFQASDSVFGPNTPQDVGVLGWVTDAEKITVTFKPSARGPFTGTVTVKGNVNGKPVQATASLKGNGVDAQLTFTPNPCDFGEVCVGESKSIRITVTNTGDFDITVTEYDWPEAPFDVISTIPRGLQLKKGESYEYNIEFTPPEEGTFEDWFGIYYEFQYKGETWEGYDSGDLIGDGVLCGPKAWAVYISALALSYIIQPPCTCPTWPACGCGPGLYLFSLVLSVLGDDPEPMPGAAVTVKFTGPNTEETKVVYTNSQGQASTSFSASTTNSGTYTAEVVGISGEYDEREMEYNPDMNTTSSVSKETQ